MSDRCRYCALEENGDIPADREPLLDFPKDGTFFLYAALGSAGNVNFIGGIRGNNEIDLCTVKIKYCPMCGKKL